MKGLNEIMSLMYRLEKGNILTESILMEATRDEIYTEYYDENNGKVKRIPRQIFDTLCEIGDVDNNPNKMSEFAKWLCDMFGTPKFDSYYVYTYNGLKQDFLTFRKLQRIKPQGINLNLRSYSLESFVVAMDKARREKLDMSQKDIKNLGSEVLYKDGKWNVIWLKTYEASMFYGRGTKWCTASDKSRNMFDQYNRTGMLVCFINLETGGKWQGHVDCNGEISEFRDAKDYEDDIYDYFDENIIDGILEKCREKLSVHIEKNWEENGRLEKEINNTFRIVYNHNIERYRIQNIETNEYLTINNKKDWEQYDLYIEYSIIFLEGNNNCILCKIDNKFINPIEKYNLWYQPYERDYPNIFIVAPNFSVRKIFNAKTLQYMNIGGTDAFKGFNCMENYILLTTLNNEQRIFSLLHNEIVRINGEENFQSVEPIGCTGNFLIKIDNMKYFYEKKNGVILKDESLKDAFYINKNIILIRAKSDIPDAPYIMAYNEKNSQFLEHKGCEVFQGYEKIGKELIVLFSSYDENDEGEYDIRNNSHLFNITKNEFSDSIDIPLSVNDVNRIYDDIVLFWDVEDNLRYFRLSTNQSYTLPLVINKNGYKDTVHGMSMKNIPISRFDHMGDKKIMIFLNREVELFHIQEGDKITDIKLK